MKINYFYYNQILYQTSGHARMDQNELNAMTEWAIRMFFRLSPICYLTWTTLQNFNTPSILSLPHYTKIHVSNTHSLSLSCDPSFVSFLARCRCRQSCTANTAACQRGVINFSYSTKANDWQSCVCLESSLFRECALYFPAPPSFCPAWFHGVLHLLLFFERCISVVSCLPLCERLHTVMCE